MRTALLLLGPIALGGVFSLVRLTTETFDVPSDADYAALTTYLDAEVRAGDAVVASPAWSLRVHAAARAHPIISGDGLASRPLDRHARVFVVVEPDGSLELPGAPAATKQIGRLQVARFDLPGRRVVFDAREGLGSAAVRIDGKKPAACDKRQRRGWGCEGRKGWQRVTREHLLVSENGDDAVWAHAPPAGETLVLKWAGVPVGDRFVVRAGFTRKGASDARAPVHLEVFVDGERVGEIVRPRAFNFAVTELKVTPKDAAEVELRIWTKNNGASHFAFDAFSSRAAP